MNTTVANQSKPETAPPSRSKFVLVPAQLVVNRIVPIEGAEKITLTLKEMFARFARSGERVAQEKIVGLRPGCYFGLMRDPQHPGQLRNFTVFNPSRDNKVDWLLRKLPQLPESIVELYEVETALRDAEITNVRSDEKNDKP
jgi:hypothetical protein